MKIDFEKVLADYGLKIGDKVKLIDCKNNPYTIKYDSTNDLVVSNSKGFLFDIYTLGMFDFEKVEEK